MNYTKLSPKQQCLERIFFPKKLIYSGEVPSLLANKKHISSVVGLLFCLQRWLFCCLSQTYTIHVWYIYLHLPSTWTKNVGKYIYISYMDPLGNTWMISALPYAYLFVHSWRGSLTAFNEDHFLKARSHQSNDQRHTIKYFQVGVFFISYIIYIYMRPF